MAQTYIRVLLHIIFSTKDRQPLIDPDIEPQLYSYMGGITRHFDSPIIAMNGMRDHVHILLGLSKTVAISELMMNIKRDSSAWIKEQNPKYFRFGWQDGYAAFSIGESQIDAVTAYIANQKTHHQEVSFQNELLAFLKKYNVPYDERYIWT